MKKSNLLILALLNILILNASVVTGQDQTQKPRTIVTSDGEVDDVDSFIRFLLYANEFDIAGLIYSSSQWHYSGDGQGTTFISEMPNTAERYGERTELRWPGTDWMQEYIGKYAQVYDNLTIHAEGYPTPDYLLSIIRVGNIEFEGEMKQDTEGSDFIKEILLDEDDSPVYMQIWGGTNTVARALKSIEEEYKNTAQWDKIYDKVSQKAVLYTVLDQDATYEKYIAPNWPRVRVLYNSDQFWSFAYLWPKVVPEELQYYLSGEWFKENIKYGRGPLLESYYLWGDGQELPGDPEHTFGDLAEAKKQGRNQYDFISEGDSPSYFYLLDVGLRSMEDASYGGWGGRMVQSEENPYRWEDGKHVTDFNPHTGKQDHSYPQTRWVDVLQQDFAARAEWCVKNYEEANHPHVVKLNHTKDLNAKRGAKVSLNGTATDPDGDKLTYKWWQYDDVDTYKGKVAVKNADKKKASFKVPEDAAVGDTIHMILEVKDGRKNPFTRYQRVIVKVVE